MITIKAHLWLHAYECSKMTGPSVFTDNWRHESMIQYIKDWLQNTNGKNCESSLALRYCIILLQTKGRRNSDGIDYSYKR